MEGGYLTLPRNTTSVSSHFGGGSGFLQKFACLFFTDIRVYLSCLSKTIGSTLRGWGYDPLSNLAVAVSGSYASESRKAQPARNRFREVEEEHVH